MGGLRSRLTYANGSRINDANVVATLALFAALGGGAYAATQLPRNSVGTAQLRDNSVTGAKVKDGSLTGTDINSLTLGPVPNASFAGGASLAKSADEARPCRQFGRPAGASRVGFPARRRHGRQLRKAGRQRCLLLSRRSGGRPRRSLWGFPDRLGRATLATRCDSGETALSGGFRETGSNAGEPGLGFNGTFELLASGPAVQGEESPVPAHAGDKPVGWYIEISYAANGSNPEVLVYVDCVPDR